MERDRDRRYEVFQHWMWKPFVEFSCLGHFILNSDRGVGREKLKQFCNGYHSPFHLDKFEFVVELTLFSLVNVFCILLISHRKWRYNLTETYLRKCYCTNATTISIYIPEGSHYSQNILEHENVVCGTKTKLLLPMQSRS